MARQKCVYVLLMQHFPRAGEPFTSSSESTIRMELFFFSSSDRVAPSRLFIPHLLIGIENKYTKSVCLCYELFLHYHFFADRVLDGFGSQVAFFQSTTCKEKLVGE